MRRILSRPTLSKLRLLTEPDSALPTYWVFQVGGWGAFALLSYFSLNVWYNPGEIIPTLHSIVQSLMGIAVSHPLRWVARRSWESSPILRIAIVVSATLAAAVLWTALRLQTFIFMTGETIDSEDWGGWFFASIIVFACWILSYHAIKYYRQWLEQQALSVRERARAQQANIQRLHAESLAREAKLQMLHYQLNPHFLFNALNSVTALVRRDDKQAAVEVLARIGDFLRTTMESEAVHHHPLRDEVAIVESYLDIEKVRFGERLNVAFDISAEAAAVSIPHLLLQPLFENCIKHAVSRRLSPTYIYMQAAVVAGWLVVRIADGEDSEALRSVSIDNADIGADTGAGEVAWSDWAQAQAQVAEHSTADESSIVASPKIGLGNVVERLRSVYSTDFHFTIATHANKSFAVKIAIPTSPNSA